MKRQNLHIISLFVALLIIREVRLQAQSPVADQYLVSPGMASLGEYGEIPVSHYTGIPEVSVPLMELSDGTHKLPISISYHGGGVNPDAHPGWTGMGWTLHAGGSITRIVCGMPDESDKYRVSKYSANPVEQQYAPKGGMFYATGIYSTFHSRYEKWRLSELKSESKIFGRIMPGFDTEPDCYMFNFMGYSGKFYYTLDGGWRVESDDNITVIFDVKDASNYTKVFDKLTNDEEFEFNRSISINNFLLIDGYGNKYYFGGKDRQDAIEYSVGFFNQHNSEIAATAWHLTRIEYADGRTAEFSYQKKDYIAEMGISDTYSMFFVHASSPYFKIDHGNRYEMYNGQSGNHDYRECDFIDGSLIIPSYLTNIKFGEYEIDFSTTPSQELEYPMERIYQMHFRPSFINQNEHLAYLQHFDVNGRSVGSKPGQYGWIQNLRWHKLSDISLKINGAELRHFNFDYNDTITESGKKQRLYLLGIAESGKGSYHFEYDRIGSLPQYCTYNVDHWGFYKETDIARINVDEYGRYSVKRMCHLKDAQYKGRRDADPTKGTIGTLTKISYPTGGYTRFEYEPNTYSAELSEDKSSLNELLNGRTAGGIRVKHIYQSPSGTGTHEYLQRRYRYYDWHTPDDTTSTGILLRPVVYKNVSRNMTGENLYNQTCNAQSIHPVGVNSDGSHVGYSCVTEELSDSSFTVYEYTDYRDYPDLPLDCEQVQLQYYKPYMSYAKCRGQLKRKSEYSASNKLQRVTEYTYSDKFESYIRSVRMVNTRCGDDFCVLDWTPKAILLKQMKPTEIKVTDYKDTVKHIETTSINYYDWTGLVTDITDRHADGKIDIRNFEYVSTTGHRTPDMDSLFLRNVLALPYSEVHKRIYGSDTELIKEDTYEYKYPNLTSPVAINRQLTASGPVQRTEITYGPYDKPLMVKDVLSGERMIYVWSYDYGHIVATIKNADLSRVEDVIGNLETIGRSKNPDYAVLKSLQTRFPNEVYIYKYLPGIGMSECINPDGTIIKYHYDAYGRLSYTTDDEDNVIEMYDYHYADE